MDVLAKTKELLGSLADVTESGSKIARYKIEVANLDRKLGMALRRVGERAWLLHTEGRSDVHGDPDVRGCFDEIRRLRARIEVIRQDIERNRSRASQEAGRAARIVQEQAGRAAAVLREEGARAAAAVRGAVRAKGGKDAARKKPGKETSDLQP
jgi:pyridoxal biosynthesis lyase PdxS